MSKKSKRDEIFDMLENTTNTPKISKKNKKRFDYVDTSIEGENRTNKKKKRNINKQFFIVTAFSVIVFLGLIVYLLFFTLIKSPEVINNPKNARQELYSKYVIRGNILDKKGNILAKSEENSDGSYSRVYPYGKLFAHCVGYTSENGNTGLEAANSFDLLSSNVFFLEKIKNDMAGNKNIGDNIVTTLDSYVQEEGAKALGNSKGAFVAIEPKTGNIIALYSNPGFDPNMISENWENLNEDNENSPLLNRATQGHYSPGSVFKTVTSLEYIRENSNYNKYNYICSGQINHEDTSIHCANESVHGDEDLYSSFYNSCNCSYANIGLKLDLARFKNTAEELLFNKKVYCPLPYSKAIFNLELDSVNSEKMMTAFGQGNTLTNPYHMALIGCAIANKGVINKPSLVSQIQNYSGDIVKKNKTSSYKKIMSAGEADILKEMMEGVVSYGTAIELSNLSYKVAGKTGTAEYSTSDKTKTHSWFLGFSNTDNPDLVVCVIVEDYNENYYKRAIPIARSILEAYHSN